MNKPKNNNPSDFIRSKVTVKIPIYSSIKLVDGKFVGKLEDYFDAPIELIRKETN